MYLPKLINKKKIQIRNPVYKFNGFILEEVDRGSVKKSHIHKHKYWVLLDMLASLNEIPEAVLG